MNTSSRPATFRPARLPRRWPGRSTAARSPRSRTPTPGSAPAPPRAPARLEVTAGDRYLWIPFAHLAAVHVDPAANLRDVRWLPARVSTGPTVREMELGEVLLPALTPAAWRSADPELRLGRATDWEELPDGDYAPVGQKLLRVDDALVPLLDVRDLVITAPVPALAA